MILYDELRLTLSATKHCLAHLAEGHRLLDLLLSERKLILSVITTDDNNVRVRPAGVDADGVSTTPTDLTATIDQPALASVAPDPDNPGAFLISRLPTTDPNAGKLSVVATFTAPSGITASLPVEFDPGTETSLSLATEIVPKVPAPTGGTAPD